jgi:hypothetical protein
VPQESPTVSPGPCSRNNIIRLSGADFMLFSHALRSACSECGVDASWPPSRPATNPTRFRANAVAWVGGVSPHGYDQIGDTSPGTQSFRRYSVRTTIPSPFSSSNRSRPLGLRLRSTGKRVVSVEGHTPCACYFAARQSARTKDSGGGVRGESVRSPTSGSGRQFQRCQA